MKHLTEGELRAALDGELGRDLLHHLEACAECQTRQSQIQTEHLRVADRLAFLAPGNEPVPSSKIAWSRFPYPTKQKETSMFKKIFAFPVARVGAVAILALAMLMAFPTTRALASELLNLFRVQQVTVLPIDSSTLEKITGNEALSDQLTELTSSSTEVTKEAGESVTVADASQASDLAKFNVRLPQEMIPSEIRVSDSSAFIITIDRVKTQTLLDEFGRDDLVLPETIDGAEIGINIPASVTTVFGACPDPDLEEGAYDRQHPSFRECLIFAQIPSPTVSAPDEINVAELAQIGLEFTGMTREEAAELAQTVDWTSTLVIPLPRDFETRYSTMELDGVTGSLIQSDSYETQYILLWVKDEIVYFVSGWGTDPARGLELINALP